MARYRVLEKSFIFDRIVEEGTEIDYDGHPGGNLEPLDEAAHAAKKHYDEVVNPKRIADLKAAYPDPAVGDQMAFAKTIAEAVATAMAAQQATLASGDAAIKATEAVVTREKAKSAKDARAEAKAAEDAAAAIAVAEEAAKTAAAAAEAEAAAFAAAASGDTFA